MAGKSHRGTEESRRSRLAGDRRRVRVEVHGIVQGVGFRPTVYRLACRLGLRGWVRNQAGGVTVEIAGHASRVAEFLRELYDQAPPLARIVDVEVSERPYAPLEAFHIVASRGDQQRLTLISPDVATCDDCLREIFDPGDRRYRYPFTNCTNCGPRYTIIRDVPYDREQTTMAPFRMCERCQREYDDPQDRRFHAQPNACWQCGPRLWLESAAGRVEARGDEAMRRVMELLATGAIVAIKGLGGFHLAVTATDEKAVARLRGRKVREEKPFAVMFAQASVIGEYCRMSDEQRRLVESSSRPIVLLPRRTRSVAAVPLAPSVAPRNRYLGAFLPYTPLHHLLFLDSSYHALVMTSGNRSDEPIVTDNRQARAGLADIADYFLLHDRAIHVRCDDSVVRVAGGRISSVRRARGYVPVPVFLQENGGQVLAVGAELKNTVCLTRGREAFVSQHIGDLENLETLAAFEFTIEHLQRILDITPHLVVHDLHPDYLSTQWAERCREVERLAVQHHHAHIGAVMAENRVSGKVLGLALDGTGYGPDATIWGGELLLVDSDSVRFQRLAHFRPLPMPGGDRAVREPWRMAVSVLYELEPEKLETVFADILERWPAERRGVLLQMLRKGLHCPRTSSCGRVFDAVSALLGLRQQISYEGQAAIELEQHIEADAKAYPGLVHCHRESSSPWIIDALPMIREAIVDLRKGEATGRIAARFHNGMIRLLAEAVARAGSETGIGRVALSGGVFQNVYLTEGLLEVLQREGFETLTHREVPPNDGCIALGQAWIGQRFLALGKEDR